MESKIATLVPGEDVPLPIVIDPDPMEHTIVPPIGLQIEKSLPSWLSRILKKHDADV